MEAPTGETDKHVPIAGMLWMGAATLFFSISFTVVKGLQDDGLTVYQAVLFRQTLGIAIFMPMIISSGLAPLRTKVPVRHFYRAAFGFIGMCTAIYWSPLSSEIWPQLIIFGVAGISAQFCLTRSFGLAQASLVSPILFFRLPLVAVIAFYAFDQQSEIWTWVGAGVIIIATTWMTHIELRISKE